MKIAHLTVDDRGFYLPPDQTDELRAAAASARDTGTWWRFRDAAGLDVSVLIPGQALLVVEEYEVDDQPADAGSSDWSALDYDEPA